MRIVGVYTYAGERGGMTVPYVEITWETETGKRVPLVLHEREAAERGVYDQWRALIDLHRVLVPSVAEAARRKGGE